MPRTPPRVFFLSFLALSGLLLVSRIQSAPPAEPFSVNEVGSTFDKGDFVRVSSALDPAVCYAVRSETEYLDLAIDVERLAENDPVPLLELAIASEREVRMDSTRLRPNRKGNIESYLFRIPRASLISGQEAWGNLRFALRVIWSGNSAPAPRLIRRFRDLDSRAGFDPISSDSHLWQPLDIAAYTAVVQARRNQVSIDFTQPIDGRASLVIESQKGTRIRNLVSGAEFSAGLHQIAWDCLDDQGNAVDPGEYRWRAVSHAGIRPNYLFSFYNEGKPPFGLDNPMGNWGGDHSNPTAAASSGNDVYLGWPLAEAGFNIVRTDLEGTKQNHFRISPHVSGGQLLLLAANAKCVFAAVEGKPYYDAIIRERDGKWKCRRPISILAWTRDGQTIRYGEATGERRVSDNLYEGTGPVPAWIPSAENLAGFAVRDDRLYVSLREENRVLVLDAVTGRTVKEISLPRPGLLAVSPDGELFAFSGEQLGLLDASTGKFLPIASPTVAAPRGLAVSSSGEFFISDNGPEQNIKVISPQGHPLRTIGRRGGRASLGAWQPDGVYQPFGIALDVANKLWVAEDDRTPRRISVWNSASGELLKELFGPTDYGAPGGSFDPSDLTRWIGGGALWKLDFATKSARPLSTLYRPKTQNELIRRLDEYRFQFVRQDERTFVLGQSRVVTVYELMADLTLKPWAVVGNLTGLADTLRWSLPNSLCQIPTVKESIAHAAEELHIDPATVFQPSGRNRSWIELSDKLIKKADVDFLWVDKNGDGQISEDEFEFLPKGTKWGLGGWGSAQISLSLGLLVDSPSKSQVVQLVPHGYLPSGAPDYRLMSSMNTAAELPAGATKTIQATANDTQSRMIVNSSPMVAYDFQGKLLWSLPNGWPGVQESHNAPLPKRGVMQAALFFLGIAPLDSHGDVTIVNGNYGRDFALTTDGIYLDEFFSDIRTSVERGPYRTEGEPFGGYFGRSEKNGKYYLQSGKPDYRIFEMLGLNTIQRSEGKLTISSEQSGNAHAIARTLMTSDEAPKQLLVVDVAEGNDLAANPNTWPGEWQAEWGQKNAVYPFAAVKFVRQGSRILLAWKVRDPSPWVNKGSDWMQLFKTGDAVVFEFSTDSSALQNRGKPVRGDRRLLIAPFGGKPMAVLYDYCNPSDKEPVLFSSPSRTEKVDRVIPLSDARVEVSPEAGGYTIVATMDASILGLPATGTNELLGDFGVIYGDPTGTEDILRSYWSNQDTGLVNDVPGEAAISPKNWGRLIFP